MHKVLLVVFGVLVMMQTGAQAQSSWDKLIKEIDASVETGQKPPQNSGEMELLSMPAEFDQPARTEASQAEDKVSAKMVMTYKCENPDIPECLWNMRSHPERVDLERCMDLAKLYIQSVASYSRCVDRRARKHAKRIVKFYNCYARKGRDCPTFYGDE